MLTKPTRTVYVPGTPGQPAVPPDPGADAYEHCYVPAPPTPPPPQCALSQMCVQIPPDLLEGGSGQLCFYYLDCGEGDSGGGGSSTPGRPPGGPWPPWSGPDPNQVCVTVPARPPHPGSPEVVAVPPSVRVEQDIGWNSGANSVQVLEGDAELKFTMDQRVVGAVIGFTTDRESIAAPERIAFGFQFVFEPGPAGSVFVVESGGRKTEVRACALGSEYSIRRVGGGVSYYIDGELVYLSRLDAGHGEISVGSALYASGDSLPSATSALDPDPDPGVLHFTGTVPPHYESEIFFLEAGDYVATESAEGARCDWFVGNMDSMQEVFGATSEGETVHFSMAQGANCLVVAQAFQAGGPFDITIAPGTPKGGK